jgi:hypothetical protein
MFFSVPAGERSSGINIVDLALISGQYYATQWRSESEGL